MTAPKFHAKAIQTYDRRTRLRRGGGLDTYRVRGYTGIVYVPGDRKPFRTGTFHNKPKAARLAAEKMGRWLVKDPANLAAALEWRDR